MPLPPADPAVGTLPGPRRPTRAVYVGSVRVGDTAPVAVQSMCKTDTRDAEATLRQIRDAHRAGAEIMRVAVPDEAAARALQRIVAESPVPIVGDIHFNYRLALAAIEAGVAKIRINPGNIGSPEKVRAVVDRAGEAGISIRVGVNGGSLERDLLDPSGHVTGRALATSALRHVDRLESWGFRDIVVSLKASDVWRTIEACRLFSAASDIPQHIGVTEAGLALEGTAKSAAALGMILGMGIGDTIRISLTGDPVDEVRVAWAILSALDLRRRGPIVVSCPTCGRTEIGLRELAERVAEAVRDCRAPITIAVMGCVVNGPGEAREADVGICGGRGRGIVFRRGEVVRKVPESELLDALLDEVRALEAEHGRA